MAATFLQHISWLKWNTEGNNSINTIYLRKIEAHNWNNETKWRMGSYKAGKEGDEQIFIDRDLVKEKRCLLKTHSSEFEWKNIKWTV